MTETICGNCRHYRADYRSSVVGCCIRARMEDVPAYHATTYNSTPECNPFCRGWKRGYVGVRTGAGK